MPLVGSVKFTQPIQALQPGTNFIVDIYVIRTDTDTIANNNAELTTLLCPLSVWAIPLFKHTCTENDSLLSIAQNYVLSIEQLLSAGYATATIIKAAAKLTIPYRPDIPKTDLYTAVSETGMTDPIAQSVSRFMLHGLRLPQISPLTFDSMNPIYDSSGQQFNVPAELFASASDYSYELELTCNPAQQWVAFKDGGSTGGVYTYTADDLAELQVFNGPYTPSSVTISQLPMMRYVPNRYALRHVILWQSSTGLAPITGTSSTGSRGEPNIWLFPDNLLNRLAGPAADHTGATLGLEPTTILRFNLSVGRQEKPNQAPQYTPVNNFAYGTIAAINLKLVKTGAGSNETIPNDYLIAGTDPDNRDLLFELCSSYRSSRPLQR